MWNMKKLTLKYKVLPFHQKWKIEFSEEIDKKASLFSIQTKFWVFLYLFGFITLSLSKKSVQNWIFLGKYLIFKKIWKILKKIHCLVKKFAFFTIGIQMARNSFFLLSIDHSLQENYFWLAKIFFEKTLIFLRRDVLILKKIWI